MDVQGVNLGAGKQIGLQSLDLGVKTDQVARFEPRAKKVELQDLNNKYRLESIKYDMRGKSYVRLQPETVYVKPELLIKKL